MVASTVSSTPRTQPLSYAERAKKAQNVKSPISVLPPPRTVVVQQASFPESTSSGSTTSTSSTSTSSGSKSASITEDTPNSSVFLTTRPSSPLGNAVDNGDTKGMNGNSHKTDTLAARALSIVEAHTSPQKSPVVNVWNVRKEQMAAARSASSQNATHPVSPAIHPPPSGPPEIFSTQTPSRRPLNTVPNAVGHGSAKPKKNGVSSSEADEDDAFVIRIPHNSSVAPLPLAAADTENWPEVGKSTSTSLTGVANSEDIKDDHEHNGGNESTQPPVTTPRKSEKIKWVPIPPQELQAAADAMRNNSRSHSRKRSQQASQAQHPQRHINTSDPATIHGVASGSEERKAHNRNRSGRNSTSHSASHSQVNSCAGSAKSSPRFPRGRRLPLDESSITGASGYSGQAYSATNRSSAVNSPLISNLPSLPQSSYVDPALVAPTAYPASSYSIPNNLSPYFPPPHLPSEIPPYSQQHYHHSSHSPLHTGSPAPMPPPPIPPAAAYPGAQAPYPVYPPYHYTSLSSSSPPYPYWNGRSHPGSGSQSPVYSPPMATYAPVPLSMQHAPPQQSMNESGTSSMPASRPDEQNISPPSLSNRVPPSEQSEAVAGYRTVAIEVVPSSVGSKPVVFGTIDVPGASQCPSPAPSRPEGFESMEKAFSAFAIGVAPGEAVLSRVQGTEEGKQGGGSEGLDAGKETKKVVKLVEPEVAKWEFGTVGLLDEEKSTKQGDISGNAVPQSLPLSSLITNLSGHEDEFEVKDFGYGFGDASGSGNAPTITREERLARQREQERERSLEQEQERQAKEAEIARELAEAPPPPPPVMSKPRRGGAGYERGGLGHERGSGYERGGSGYERGGSGYERGSSGYERGGFSGRRGRWMNGFSRGYNRNFGRGGFHHPPHQRQPSFNVTPPQHFQSVPHIPDPANGYFPPPRQLVGNYMAHGHDAYQFSSLRQAPLLPTTGAPVPIPLSTLSFPIDATRWYLLGQLEYYLSPQNMAQDFFLRQRMDSRGWIPILLIASFNRVRQLTMDIPLVREVLVLSTLVQVRDNYVRMDGWERYVLPDAAPSVFDREEYPGPHTPVYYDEQANYSHKQSQPPVEQNGTASFAQADRAEPHKVPNANVNGHVTVDPDPEDVYDDEEEDEEEEIVFVMGKEAGMWIPER